MHGVNGLNDVKFDDEPDQTPIQTEVAADAIRRLAKENSGDLVIITLGPLTNLALALKTEPNVAKDIKELYIMGGNTTGEGNVVSAAEFNFHCDPEAAFVVLDMIKCPAYVIPWELCYHSAVVDYKWCLDVLFNVDTPEGKFMRKIEMPWLDRLSKLPISNNAMCDELAMAVALDNSIIQKTSKQLVNGSN